MPIDFISFAYAATVATGGIIGYTKAGKLILWIYEKDLINRNHVLI